jgi:hypothetical protein
MGYKVRLFLLLDLNVEKGCAIALEVSRRLLTEEARVRSQVSFVVNKEDLGQVSVRVLQFSPVNISSPLLHIHSCIIWGLHRDLISPHRNNNKGMKMTVYWDVAPCSLVEIDRRFIGG